MTTEVTICNMSLGHIKAKTTIASLTENSNEARKCNLYYAQARDETLEEFNWPFAKRFATLAVTGTPPTGWIYQYAIPSDALVIRKVLTEYKEDKPVPFELALSELSDSVVILTDREAAEVEYTKGITNPTLFSALFSTALSYKLASYIAIPLTGKRDLRKDAIDLFNFSIHKARAAALNESQKIEEPDASWIDAR